MKSLFYLEISSLTVFKNIWNLYLTDMKNNAIHICTGCFRMHLWFHMDRRKYCYRWAIHKRRDVWSFPVVLAQDGRYGCLRIFVSTPEVIWRFGGYKLDLLVKHQIVLNWFSHYPYYWDCSLITGKDKGRHRLRLILYLRTCDSCRRLW